MQGLLSYSFVVLRVSCSPSLLIEYSSAAVQPSAATSIRYVLYYSSAILPASPHLTSFDDDDVIYINISTYSPGYNSTTRVE